jgi:MOSC domain-containing protein YiiM
LLSFSNEDSFVTFCGVGYHSPTIVVDGADIIARLSDLSRNNSVLCEIIQNAVSGDQIVITIETLVVSSEEKERSYIVRGAYILQLGSDFLYVFSANADSLYGANYDNQIIYQDSAPLYYDSGAYEAAFDKAVEMIREAKGRGYHVWTNTTVFRETEVEEVEQLCDQLAGLGVEGDAHQGRKIKHRSRVARDPDQPNLRQVHLIQAELHDELNAGGFTVGPGDMGENVTTRGIDLLGLPTGTRLRLGGTATIEVTGLRNPCVQLDQFQSGLMAAVLDRDEEGRLVRKAGVMGIVESSGAVRPGDPIRVELPPEPHVALAPV